MNVMSLDIELESWGMDFLVGEETIGLVRNGLLSLGGIR